MLFDANASLKGDYLAHKHFYSDARRSLLLKAYADAPTSICTPRMYARQALRSMSEVCLGHGEDAISQMLYDLYYMMLMEVEIAFERGKTDGGDEQAAKRFAEEITRHICPTQEREPWEKEADRITWERSRNINDR